MKSTQFALVCYLTIDEIKEVLLVKSSQIVSYAFIEHDKDIYTEYDCLDRDTGEINVEKIGTKKPIHQHIYLKLVQSREVSSIRNWFKLKDENGKKRNCLSQPVYNREGIIKYLTHKTRKAIFQDKYQYDEKDVISFNLDINDEDFAVDKTFDIITDINTGLRTIDLIRRYGREYVYHYAQLEKLAQRVAYDQKNEDYLNSLAVVPTENMPFKK